MRYTMLRNLMFILAIALVGVACSGSTTGSDAESAQVEGRVDNTSSSSQKAQYKPVEGAVVTAARVTSSGELETIGNAETETNAEGEFTLQISADAVAESANKVVIVAENNGQAAKAFVTAEVESGSTVHVQPLTFESTSETSVYQEVIANGDVEIVSKADIEAMVNTEVAQNIESNASNAAEVASALAAQAEAKAQFYSKQGIELTEEQMNTIAETKTEAMLKLESRLNETTSSEEKQGAFDTFVEAVAKAEMQADVQASAVAKASESSMRVLLKQSTVLSAEAKASLRKHAAYMTTFALQAAVETQMQAVNTSESTITAAVDAAATLRADIKAMSSATKEDIDAVFESFNTEIEALMESDANIDGELFVSANSNINSNNGAKASLESTLESTLNFSLIFDAYSQFYSDVQSTVNSTFSNASDAEAEAYTQLLILINLAS